MPNFLDLPAEIRCMIYSQVASPSNLALFNTSKFVRNEGALSVSQTVSFFISQSIPTPQKATPLIQDTILWLSIVPAATETGLWRINYLSGSEITRTSCNIFLIYSIAHITEDLLASNAIIQALKTLIGFQTLFIHVSGVGKGGCYKFFKKLEVELAPSLGAGVFFDGKDKRGSEDKIIHTPYLKFSPYSSSQAACSSP